MRRRMKMQFPGGWNHVQKSLTDATADLQGRYMDRTQLFHVERWDLQAYWGRGEMILCITALTDDLVD